MQEQPIATQLAPQLTPQEYLALERTAETKSEYVDGTLMAMTGPSRNHNLISENMVREPSLQLRGRPCQLYAQDMRVRISERAHVKTCGNSPPAAQAIRRRAAVGEPRR